MADQLAENGFDTFASDLEPAAGSDPFVTDSLIHAIDIGYAVFQDLRFRHMWRPGKRNLRVADRAVLEVSDLLNQLRNGVYEPALFPFFTQGNTSAPQDDKEFSQDLKQYHEPKAMQRLADPLPTLRAEGETGGKRAMRWEWRPYARGEG